MSAQVCLRCGRAWDPNAETHRRFECELPDGSLPKQRGSGGTVERSVLLALAPGRRSVAQVAEDQRRYAEQIGERGLPTVTLWRRLRTLEARGWITRETRLGGYGGSISVLAPTRPLAALARELGGSPQPAHPSDSWGRPVPAVRGAGPGRGSLTVSAAKRGQPAGRAERRVSPEGP